MYLDLQPQNVRFDKWHKIHLLDFDTALSLDDTSQIDLSYRPVTGYMAPELLEKGNQSGPLLICGVSVLASAL